MRAAPRGAALPTGVVAVLLVVAVIAASVVIAAFPAVQRWSGDVRLFEHYTGEVFSGTFGQTPFLSWYPPLSLIPLGLPRLVGDGPIYTFALGVEMALVAAVGLVVVNRLAPTAERVGALWGYAALVVLATALIAWRYDLVPAVLTLAAIWASTERRPWLAGLLVGLAAGLKLYAVILVPVIAVVAWRRDGTRAAVGALAAAALAGLAATAPYLLFPGVTPLDLLAFTASRPLQVETVPGSVIALLAAFGIGEAPLEFGFGSFNLQGPAAEAALGGLRVVQPVVLGASVGAAMLAAARGAVDRRSIVLMTIVVLLGLTIANRVLSPQYLVWILPVIPLVAHRPIGWLVAIAIGLTVVVFPWWYSALLDLDPVPLATIVVRNALLIGAWAIGLWTLVRMSRVTSPVPVTAGG